jgi:hypothetical protein
LSTFFNKYFVATKPEEIIIKQNTTTFRFLSNIASIPTAVKQIAPTTKIEQRIILFLFIIIDVLTFQTI